MNYIKRIFSRNKNIVYDEEHFHDMEEYPKGAMWEFVKECADKYLYPYGKKGKIVAYGSNNDDIFWKKVFFEGEYWDEEDKEAFRDDNWIEINSPYDCTGKTFTWAIDSFNVPNGVVAYIRYAIDV